MFACLCAAVTETRVRAAICSGARTVEEIGEDCDAGTGCGSCVERLELLLGARERQPHELGPHERQPHERPPHEHRRHAPAVPSCLRLSLAG